MNSSKRNLYIGASATVLLGVVVFAYLLPSVPEPAPKPPIVIEPVHMPPAPPEPTPEQLAAAKAAEEVAIAEAEALAKAEANAKALAEAKRKQRATTTQKKVTVSKGKRTVTEVTVAATEQPPKPKEVRFNMTQDGKKMSAEDFDAWMKAQGIRIVPAKPVAPVKTDDGSGN